MSGTRSIAKSLRNTGQGQQSDGARSRHHPPIGWREYDSVRSVERWKKAGRPRFPIALRKDRKALIHNLEEFLGSLSRLGGEPLFTRAGDPRKPPCLPVLKELMDLPGWKWRYGEGFSVSRIARDAGYSREWAARALRQLENLELLQIVTPNPGGMKSRRYPYVNMQVMPLCDGYWTHYDIPLRVPREQYPVVLNANALAAYRQERAKKDGTPRRKPTEDAFRNYLQGALARGTERCEAE